MIDTTYSIDRDGIGEYKDTNKGEDSSLGAYLSGDSLNSLDT